jgi:hypothetical protein
MPAAGDWQQIERSGRDQARLCAQNAREAAEAGSAVGAREWAEAAGAAVIYAADAQRARLDDEEFERERVRA